MSHFLRPHGHVRLPCPSPTPRACSNSCPLNQWCHPTISSSATLFSSYPSSGSLSSIRVFSNELSLHVRWPKYWSFSFSISLSNGYSELTFFKTDWFDLLAVQGTLQEFFPAPELKSINSLVLSFLYGPTRISITWILEKPYLCLDGSNEQAFF